MVYEKRCWGDGDPASEKYHDEEWGMPLKGDNEFFERLSLEMFQAGLSWRTILHKRQAFRKAFANFSIKRVAGFTQRDVKRLLNDKSIIRNELKIKSVIYNAKVFLQLKAEFGSFEKWLDTIDVNDAEVYKVFKKHFKFMGPEVVKSFLMSASKIPSWHGKNCWKYR